MAKHSHHFVEQYQGLVGFGADRQTDEQTIKYYLQKFSDDELLQTLVPLLADTELEAIFDLITRLLKAHLSEPQYHTLFLKD